MTRLIGTTAMSPETRTRVAASGGRATLAKYGPAYLAKIGGAGGRAHSKEHMAKIGAVGGTRSQKNRREAAKKP